MIEQGRFVRSRRAVNTGPLADPHRLRAWIDQPVRCLYFESHSAHDTDGEAKGTAGGLRVEDKEKEIEPVTWTERWDDRIRYTSMQVGPQIGRCDSRDWLTSHNRSSRSLQRYRLATSYLQEVRPHDLNRRDRDRKDPSHGHVSSSRCCKFVIKACIYHNVLLSSRLHSL